MNKDIFVFDDKTQVAIIDKINRMKQELSEVTNLIELHKQKERESQSHFSASIYDRTDRQDDFVGNFITFKSAVDSCLKFIQEKQGRRIEYVNSRIVEAQKLEWLLVGYENDLSEIGRLRDE